MKIDIDQIKKLEKLANLSLTDERRDKITHNLQNILSYVASLQKLDTSGVSATFNASGLKNIAVEDEPVLEDSLTSEQALSNASEKVRGMFKTKKVINK